jgi:hypothetical protein
VLRVAANDDALAPALDDDPTAVVAVARAGRPYRLLESHA